MADVCDGCGRPFAKSYSDWKPNDVTCGMAPTWNPHGERHEDCINECLYGCYGETTMTTLWRWLTLPVTIPRASLWLLSLCKRTVARSSARDQQSPTAEAAASRQSG